MRGVVVLTVDVTAVEVFGQLKVSVEAGTTAVSAAVCTIETVVSVLTAGAEAFET